MINFIYQDIPFDDPIAVVDTYHNAWWDNSHWPANSYTASMNCDNISHCMEVHRLALMSVSLHSPPPPSSHPPPMEIYDGILSPIPAILKTLPSPTKVNCTSCKANYSLVLQSVDALERVYKFSVDSAASLSALTDAAQDRVAAIQSLQDMSFSADLDNQWQSFCSAKKHSETETSVETAPLKETLPIPRPPSLDAEPDDDWMAMIHKGRSKKPDRNSEISQTSASLETNSELDIDNSWRAFTKRRHNINVVPTPAPTKQKIKNMQGPTIEPDSMILDLEDNWQAFTKKRQEVHSLTTPQNVASHKPALSPLDIPAAQDHELMDLESDWRSFSQARSGGGIIQTGTLPRQAPIIAQDPVPPTIPPPANHREVWWTTDHKSQAQLQHSADTPTSVYDIIENEDYEDSDEDISPESPPSCKFTLSRPSSVQRQIDAAYFDAFMDNNVFDDLENEAFDADEVEL